MYIIFPKGFCCTIVFLLQLLRIFSEVYCNSIFVALFILISNFPVENWRPLCSKQFVLDAFNEPSVFCQIQGLLLINVVLCMLYNYSSITILPMHMLNCIVFMQLHLFTLPSRNLWSSVSNMFLMVQKLGVVFFATNIAVNGLLLYDLSLKRSY